MQKGIIKNVNKLTGEAIDAKDLASMLSGIIGNESGVLTVFDELRLEKISDNKVRLHSGVYSLKGHILYIPKGSYEDFEIESGTLGANRIDLLVAEYVKNGEGDGEDTFRFRVIKGEATSGTPQEPDLIQQDINENGITLQEIIYKMAVRNTVLEIHTAFRKIMNLSETEKFVKRLVDDTKKEVKNRTQPETNQIPSSKILNGWSTHFAVNYDVIGNLIVFRGRVNAKSDAQLGEIIFVLPEKHRPSQQLQFYVGNAKYITIYPNGNVVGVGTTGGYYLNSIVFVT